MRWLLITPDVDHLIKCHQDVAILTVNYKALNIRNTFAVANDAVIIPLPHVLVDAPHLLILLQDIVLRNIPRGHLLDISLLRLLLLVGTIVVPSRRGVVVQRGGGGALRLSCENLISFRLHVWHQLRKNWLSIVNLVFIHL